MRGWVWVGGFSGEEEGRINISATSVIFPPAGYYESIRTNPPSVAPMYYGSSLSLADDAPGEMKH